MHSPDPARYDSMTYRRTGRSGLDLPAVSLGLWHNFGDDVPFDRQEQVLRRAFDLGITHFDLANNYGPPYGSAEENFGRHLTRSFAGLRDELVISSKAGWDMWPGPYGQVGGSRKYLVTSLDQSLRRMGLDYVDIFYHHRPDPTTPLEETMGALDAIVRSGKALYVGISSYSADATREAAATLADLGTPLLIHQPSYSMLNRWIEQDRLLDTLEEVGAGCIAFSPLAQGMLTLLNSGGKRLRPALALLASRFHTSPAPIEPIVSLAAAVETLHTATLVHDDLIGQVVDGAVGGREVGIGFRLVVPQPPRILHGGARRAAIGDAVAQNLHAAVQVAEEHTAQPVTRGQQSRVQRLAVADQHPLVQPG